ncbi:hypothetical protein D3C83_275940 [compost metagenome]
MFCCGVEGGGGLIEYDDIRIVDDRLRDAGALLESPRQGTQKFSTGVRQAAAPFGRRD